MSSLGRSLGQIVALAKLKFGKTDPLLVESLESNIDHWLREICSDFPYWFLQILPGFFFSNSFPWTTDPAEVNLYAGRWLDQGWLLTAADKDWYEVFVPYYLSPEEAPSSWTAAEISQIKFAKQFSFLGSCQADCEVVDANLFYSGGSFSPNTAANAGYPWRVMHQVINGKSYIRITPRPTEPLLFCFGFQLAYPPWMTQANGDRVNLLSYYYPRLLELLVRLEFAEYYSEIKMEQSLIEKIWGSTDRGINRADIPRAGIIGRMKNDTDRRIFQDITEDGFWRSAVEAVGRGGRFNHRPGAQFYYGPSGY